MSDLEDNQLRGPVHTVTREFSTIDPQTNEWRPFRGTQTVVYDAAGQLEGRVRDDGVISTTVDARGLRTTVSRGSPRIARQPGMEVGIGMDPNMLADILSRYDAAGRPIEITYRDAQQRSLHRIELTYDTNGRLFREKTFIGDVVSGFRSNQAIAAGKVGPLTAEELAELRAGIKAMIPTGVFTTREYEYDQRGRVVQLRSTMAGLSETLQTYSYDDHDNIVEEHREEASRDADLDPSGRRITMNETSSEGWSRHVYVYDEHGNWIERVSFQRESAGGDFRRVSIERRTITYY